MSPKRLLNAIPALPIAGAAALLGQVLYAAHRPGLPSLHNQDPSGVFGPRDLPALRIVALGDSSITAPGVEPLDHVWIRRVAHHLADRYHVVLHSVAVGGSKARDVINNQLETAFDLAPDLAVLSVGANDALRGTLVPRFEAEMDMIVGSLHEAVPAVLVGGIGDLGTIPRLPSLPGALARLRGRAFDAAIARVVAGYDHAAKTDTWSALWEPFAAGDPELFAADQFHVSAKGHGIFADAAIPVVEELLSGVGPAEPGTGISGC